MTPVFKKDVEPQRKTPWGHTHLQKEPWEDITRMWLTMSQRDVAQEKATQSSPSSWINSLQESEEMPLSFETHRL